MRPLVKTPEIRRQKSDLRPLNAPSPLRVQTDATGRVVSIWRQGRLTPRSIAAIQDCWVEFTTPAGGYLSQDYVVGGSSMTWTFHRNVTMQIGNPGGILLTVNGKNLGRPGSVGQPVTLSFGPDKKLPAQASG